MPQCFLRIYLNFGHFSASCSCTKGSYKKECAQFSAFKIFSIEMGGRREHGRGAGEGVVGRGRGRRGVDGILGK